MYLTQYLDQPFDPSQLLHIRRDVVDTVRKAVDLVGKAAATYLPETDDNRSTLRNFLLGVPSRLSEIISRKTMAPSRANSERAEVQQVLDIAQESRDMLSNVQTVFKQSVSQVEKLIGESRQRNGFARHDEMDVDN